MKNLKSMILVYAFIPFVSSVPGLVLNLCGLSDITVFVVPLIAFFIYIFLRKKINMNLAAKINGTILIVLLLCFTIMMLFSSGNIEGVLMSYFSWFIMPFVPIMLIFILMGQMTLLYSTAFLTYAIAFIITGILGNIKIKRTLVPLMIVIVSIIINVVLYNNRPSVKYAGHGFDYMHGYSSTDFSDYMVYSENSKLIIPESKVNFIIENEEDMPKMDGAEACYPLYAALAKAVYKNIDKIELNWLKETNNPYCNGKIVTFTNSLNGFERLIYGSNNDNGIDMFFGARPSASQMQAAKDCGVELEITPIGKEAFVFFVEKNTPVNDLTSDQIKGIYHGDITNWNELGGNNQNIVAFQRPKNSGSQTMMEYFMKDISLKEPQTYETINAMEGVIKQVAQYNNEEGAIGYTFRYFLEGLHQEKDVKMIKVDGVTPTLKNINNSTYPLVTNLCLITRKNEKNPNVKKMIDFILSDAGQEIIRKTGYGTLK